MRKIEQDACRALINGERFRCKNTECDGDTMYLHGNAIAWRHSDGMYSMTLAGWNTVTTRSRLNALCNHLGMRRVGFCQRNHAPYLLTDGAMREIGEREVITFDPREHRDA